MFNARPAFGKPTAGQVFNFQRPTERLLLPGDFVNYHDFRLANFIDRH